MSGLAWLLIGILFSMVFIKRREIFESFFNSKHAREKTKDFQEKFVYTYFQIIATIITNPIFAFIFIVFVVAMFIKMVS